MAQKYVPVALRHFRLAGARVEPLTPTGRVTVRLLQRNHPDRIEEREPLLRLGPLPPPQTSASTTP